MSDDELLAGFQAGTLEEFPHRAHVHVAWLYLRRDTPLRAIERFSVDLRRFALAKGRPGHYHETLTLAFLFLIHERMSGEGEDFDGFQARNPDLFHWNPSAVKDIHGLARAMRLATQEVSARRTSPRRTRPRNRRSCSSRTPTC